MNKLTLILCGVILVSLSSCKEDNPEKPKVIYEDSSKARNVTPIDTSRIAIADLPIQIPGINYLIHPIGDFRSYEGRNKSYGYDKGSFTISNFGEYEITGFLHNLKFQDVATDSLKPLTDKRVLIQTITYLKQVSDKANQKVLLYTMADMDTNKDGRLDSNDIRALYLSESSGDRLTKISTDYQELVDWHLVDAKNRLYFRTIEDANKNGEFDPNDVMHYHYIEFSNATWEVQEYNPI